MASDERTMAEEIAVLRARLDRLEAKEAVVSTFNEYLHALDAARVDELVEVFSAEATMEAVNFPPGSGETRRLTGREELRALYERFPASILRHHAANVTVVVDVAATTAELSAYFVRSGAYEFGGGLYQGTFRDEGDRWRILTWRVTSTWGWRVRSERPPQLADTLGAGALRDGRPVVYRST